MKGTNMTTTQQATYLPLGAAKAHHMPEEYYEKWEKLRAAEKRAYIRARELATNAAAWARWERAQRKLVEHENEHNYLGAQAGQNCSKPLSSNDVPLARSVPAQ